MKYRSRGPRIYIAMWMRAHRYELRRGLQLFGILCAALYLGQIFYPANRTLPFVHAGGQGVGSQSVTEATATLTAAYKRASFVVSTDDTKTNITLADVGGTARTSEAAAKAADYPFLQRLVPFSALYIMAQRDVPVAAQFKGAALSDFAAKIAQDAQRDAIDASIAIKDNKAQLVPAVPSKAYPSATTEKAIRAADFTSKSPIVVRPQTTPAPRTDKMVHSTIDAANKAIDNPPKVVIAGKTTNAKGADVASWLQFPEDATTKQLSLALKQDAVAAYLAGIQGDAYVAPGKTTVRTVDGREVSRAVGRPGKGVDAQEATPKLLAALQTGTQQKVDLAVRDIPPEIIYDRVTSNADAAFANVVAATAKAKGGFGISVMEINGRSSNANGDKQFVAASTYKLYVAYMWFKRIEAGKATWGDTINGQRADKCFEVMIVNSDNPCAKAFATAVGGWGVVDAGMKNIGLRHTSLATGSLYTTANDLAYFMYRLENGTLVGSADRTRLIDLMKRQKYRDGLPAGTGVTVANKVGFVDGYLNDPGIIYAPKGTYIMVIMSYGSSWSQIADAAKQIQNYLN